MKVGRDGWLPVNRKTGIDITGEFEIRSTTTQLMEYPLYVAPFKRFLFQVYWI